MSFAPQPNLPSEIQSYIRKHFPGQDLVKYKTEWTPHKAEYKVYLSNHVKIEFNKDFNPVEVEGKLGLPDSILPKKILNFIKKNYPDMKFFEWSKKSYKQEVELQNDKELEFDLKGNFLKID
jgi:hypothetical protein